MPLSTVLGRSATPGEAAGFGLLEAQEARDLVAAAARHPGTRWCLTVLHPDGTAAAHGCAAGRHPPPPAAGHPATGGGGADPPPGGRPGDWLHGLRISLHPVIRGPCDHGQAEVGYRPSRTLRHLVRARNAQCTASGCGRPAARCDLDHTRPWHRGGLTCPCDLAPPCKR